MINLPNSLRRLIKELADIPSIGPRQATRIAFYLASEGKDKAAGAAGALHALSNIKTCKNCFFIFEPESKTFSSSQELENELCEICRDPARDKNTVMVLEKETDLISMENTGKYTGRYLVIGSLPKTGLLENWQKERLSALQGLKEIILALNPTSLGDFHASLLSKELAGTAQKISRLGRGLPTGGEIEFADSETLSSALSSRG